MRRLQVAIIAITIAIIVIINIYTSTTIKKHDLHQKIIAKLTHAVYRIAISLSHIQYTLCILCNKLLKCICRQLHCATWSFNKPKQIIFSPSHTILFMNKVFRFWASVYFHYSWIQNSWIDLQVLWGWFVSYPESTINCVICEYTLDAAKRRENEERMSAGALQKWEFQNILEWWYFGWVSWGLPVQRNPQWWYMAWVTPKD